MTSSVSLLADTLSASVPAIEASGANWAIFSLRFRDAVEAKGFWGHFDGSTPHPRVASGTPTTTGSADAGQDSSSDADAQALATAIARWERDERAARSLLTQKLPDSALMLVRKLATVHERWQAITREFTRRGSFAQTQLRAEFLDVRCGPKEDVKLFLDDLRTKREELATLGVDISDADYLSTIITSLPFALSNFAASLLATYDELPEDRALSPDALILKISAEYSRQASHERAQRSDLDDERDEALYVSEARGRRRGSPKSRSRCFECGEKSHWQRDCPQLKVDNGKGKARADSPKPSEAAGMVLEVDSDFDDALAAVSDSDSECGSMPDLQDVVDSDDGSGSDARDAHVLVTMCSVGEPSGSGSARELGDADEWWHRAMLEELAAVQAQGGIEKAADAFNGSGDWFYKAGKDDEGADSDDGLAEDFPNDGRDSVSRSQGGEWWLDSGSELVGASPEARDASARVVEGRAREPGVAEDEQGMHALNRECTLRAPGAGNGCSRTAQAAKGTGAEETRPVSVLDTGGSTGDVPQDVVHPQHDADAGVRLPIPWLESMEGAVWRHNETAREDLGGAAPCEVFAEVVFEPTWSAETLAWSGHADELEESRGSERESSCDSGEDLGGDEGAKAPVNAEMEELENPEEPPASARGLVGEYGQDSEPRADELTFLELGGGNFPSDDDSTSLSPSPVPPDRPPDTLEGPVGANAQPSHPEMPNRQPIADRDTPEPNEHAPLVQLQQPSTPVDPEHAQVLEGEPHECALQAAAAETLYGAAVVVDPSGTDVQCPELVDTGWSAQFCAERRPWVITGDRGPSAPVVARLSSIRTVLAIAAVDDLEIEQISFENEDLPPENLDDALRKLGFTFCMADSGLWARHEGDGGGESQVTVILKHAAKWTIAATAGTLIKRFKRRLAKFGSITDLGAASSVLDIHIHRDRARRTIILSQTPSIDFFVKKCNLDAVLKPRTATANSADHDAFYNAILNFLTRVAIGTRPDIAYAVHALPERAEDACQTTWQVIRQVLRHLEATRDLGLIFGAEAEPLEGIAGAGIGAGVGQGRLTHGYVFTLHGAAVSWCSQPQDRVALSSMEADCIAANHAIEEGIRLRNLIIQLFDDLDENPILRYSAASPILSNTGHRYEVDTPHLDLQGTHDIALANLFTTTIPLAKRRLVTQKLGLVKACGGVLE
ncbi:hypothetical protein HGRIS_014920 [Hohenbuehelia grisea]|uniref:CCHC-type domain-containing protein n=1 Tax=Hohenbuehelia grisea TaxID=104357 RepID=A0ABR3JG53_9AGAR